METGFPHAPPCGEGLGGRSPPKNNTIFILALCALRMGSNVNKDSPRAIDIFILTAGRGFGEPRVPRLFSSERQMVVMLQ